MYDSESPLIDGQFSFDEISIRHGFIRKVYAILSVQLLVTLGFIALFVFVDDIRLYVEDQPWMLIVAMILTFVLLIALVCFESLRRQTPTNFILLGLFTLCESFLLGVISSQYDTKIVLVAITVTAIVAVSLTIFAFQTKIDFTIYSGLMFVVLICLIVFGIIAIIFPNDILTAVYGSLGALVFSAYLVIDTQMMIGGKHRYSLSPEEYIFAAINLYLDIINIFLYILTILSALDR
ncbi:protein lifeguard 1-like [Symsagittifera roscoffensis]|uniref:protein lifeguard 1-like n=1 Tax=Symsagittifera roscoffensis TaxID=84072 RepID=UPI00307C7A2E